MVAFVEQFVLRFIFHHEADKQGRAKRGQHKQDVAADIVKGIKNVFTKYGNIFPWAVAQDGRDIAEDKNTCQYDGNRGCAADFGFLLNGRNQHFINGQRGGQRGNQKQGEENHCKHWARPHIGEHDRQALEHQRRAGVRGNAKAEEGWENHKAGQHGNQSVGNRGNHGRLNQIFVFIQIAG